MRHLQGLLASVFVAAILTTILFAGTAGHGTWLTKVPENARNRPNPLDGDPTAAVAGEKLFEQHCAQCHGADAEGGKGPNLRSQHVAQATPGEIEWFLTNGSLKNGMPSWSRLPQSRRWQLVKYLKSIQKP
jgi:mono/diheme cytochrome c family protein